MRFSLNYLMATLVISLVGCKSMEGDSSLEGINNSKKKVIPLKEKLSDYIIQGDYRILQRSFVFRSTKSAKDLLSKECVESGGSIRVLPEYYKTPQGNLVALVCETGNKIPSERVEIVYAEMLSFGGNKMYKGERVSTINARNKCINSKGVPDEEKELDIYASIVVCVHSKKVKNL